MSQAEKDLVILKKLREAILELNNRITDAVASGLDLEIESTSFYRSDFREQPVFHLKKLSRLIVSQEIHG